MPAAGEPKRQTDRAVARPSGARVTSIEARRRRPPGPRRRCGHQQMNETPGPNARHPLRIALRDGFRGHAVVITVDGREVYRGSGVTTDPRRAHADAVDLSAEAAPALIVVSVNPGDLAASLELDVSRHSHVAISLVGRGTVSFETSSDLW